MAGVAVQVDDAMVDALRAFLRDKPGRERRVVAGALNDAAKHARSFVSQLIRDEIDVKKQDVDKFIKIKRAVPSDLTAVVTLSESERIPLKYFGARQTAHGVTYRIGKGQPRQTIPDAFGPDIPRLGGNVFRRVGKSRLPIVKLLGPSPWAVFLRAGGRRKTKQDITEFLHNRLQHRLEYQK